MMTEQLSRSNACKSPLGGMAFMVGSIIAVIFSDFFPYINHAVVAAITFIVTATANLGDGIVWADLPTESTLIEFFQATVDIPHLFLVVILFVPEIAFTAGERSVFQLRPLDDLVFGFLPGRDEDGLTG
jgi:hypothetical protein